MIVSDWADLLWPSILPTIRISYIIMIADKFFPNENIIVFPIPSILLQCAITFIHLPSGTRNAPFVIYTNLSAWKSSLKNKKKKKKSNLEDK